MSELANTPASAAEVAAYMVDCGNTAIAQGDVRFWRASRRQEAETVASMYGATAVPLYRFPTPGRAAEPDAMREVERLLFELRAASAEAEVAAVSDRINGETFAELVSDLHKAEEALKLAFRTIVTERDEALARAETAEAQLATLRADVDDALERYNEAWSLYEQVWSYWVEGQNETSCLKSQVADLQAKLRRHAAQPNGLRSGLEKAIKIAEDPGFIQARDTEWDEGVNYAKRFIAEALRAFLSSRPEGI